jgi:indole-3-glycerol phosphate synthase
VIRQREESRPEDEPQSEAAVAQRGVGSRQDKAMILDEIVANKAIELNDTRRDMPLAKVKALLRRQGPPKDFAAALRGDSIKLIAEVKKASPSKGVIVADFDPPGTARIYADNGAAAISVLTESKHFQGSLEILDAIGTSLGENRPPLLRKDFLFDPYQIYEARAHGADALLLIVAVLTPTRLKELTVLTHSLRMECLVEVHNEAEVDVAIGAGARVIGINNRDLRTFTVDLGTTERLRPRIPRDLTVVSESGIRTAADMKRLRECGVDAVLIGEALMSAPDIPVRIRELL